MSIVTDIYRKYMPINIRFKIGKFRTRRYENSIYKRVCDGEWDAGFKTEADFMRDTGRIDVFPYEWAKGYEPSNIKVYKDFANNMPFVNHRGKKLYFPKRYPADYIRIYYNTILIEQDPRSSHYYFDPYDERLYDTVFVDVGAAEGAISLSVVDRVREVIIFESDPDWIKALKTTFEPWKSRVTIINKFADETSCGNRVTIDEIMSDKSNVVLKMDVEGMEAKVLAGAVRTLEKNDTKAFVCTYHKPNDQIELVRFLESKGYSVEIPSSYMFYGTDDVGFRKGIARAWERHQ